MSVAEQILKNSKKTIESERNHLVKKLVKCDIISTICDAMQTTSDENFVKYAVFFYVTMISMFICYIQFLTSSCKSRLKNVYGDSTLVRRVILELLDIISVYKEFYENNTAKSAIKSMLRVSYCLYTSLKDTVLFEEIVQCVCNILVRYIFFIFRHLL